MLIDVDYICCLFVGTPYKTQNGCTSISHPWRRQLYTKIHNKWSYKGWKPTLSLKCAYLYVDYM